MQPELLVVLLLLGLAVGQIELGEDQSSPGFYPLMFNSAGLLVLIPGIVIAYIIYRRRQSTKVQDTEPSNDKQSA